MPSLSPSKSSSATFLLRTSALLGDLRPILPWPIHVIDDRRLVVSNPQQMFNPITVVIIIIITPDQIRKSFTTFRPGQLALATGHTAPAVNAGWLIRSTPRHIAGNHAPGDLQQPPKGCNVHPWDPHGLQPISDRDCAMRSLKHHSQKCVYFVILVLTECGSLHLSGKVGRQGCSLKKETPDSSPSVSICTCFLVQGTLRFGNGVKVTNSPNSTLASWSPGCWVTATRNPLKNRENQVRLLNVLN